MTIAIGILATGGFILAADSQETAGLFKTDARKIVTWPPAESCAASRSVGKACAIAGAGYAGYIDCISQELLDVFCAPDTSVANWPKRVRSHISRFYRQHVIPFGPASDLDFSLLITAQFTDAACLLTTNKTVVIQGPPAMAIGYGESTAKNLLNEVGGVLLDVRSAALLAAYVVYRVKQSVEFCGHHTQVVIIQGGQAKEIDREATVAWDILFRKYDVAAARFLWDTLSSHGEPSATVSGDPLASIKSGVRRVVAETMGNIDDQFFKPVSASARRATSRSARPASKRDQKARPLSQE